METIKVSQAIFENFHQSVNGSVFSLQDRIISIECCTFNENSCQKYGGCIYCYQSDLTIKKTSFFHCCSIGHQPNIYGNVLLLHGKQARINNINTHLCSYSDTKCGDSSICFLYSLVNIKYLNASSNFGYSGGSGFTMKWTEENSNSSYANIVDSRDESVFQTQYGEYSVYNSNFIDCSQCSGQIIYQSKTEEITLYNCIFKNTGNVPFTNSCFHIKAYETKADREYFDIKQDNSLSIIAFHVNYQCNQETFEFCNNKLNLNTLKFLLFIFLIKT